MVRLAALNFRRLTGSLAILGAFALASGQALAQDAAPAGTAPGAPGAPADPASVAPVAPSAAPAAVAAPVAQPVPPRPVPLAAPLPAPLPAAASPPSLAAPAAPSWMPAPVPRIGSGPAMAAVGSTGAKGMPPVGQAHVVRPGETLDIVIARTVGQSPLKPQVVRDAIVQANPHAFIQGNPHRLVAGATIVIPTPGGLRDHAFPEQRAASPPALTEQQVLEAKAMAARNAPPKPRGGGPDEDRRRWVRYP